MPYSRVEHSEFFWGSALREAVYTFAVAAIVLGLLFVPMVFFLHPDLQRFSSGEAKALRINASELQPISLGGGYKDRGKFLISDFKEDEAILVLQKEFRAEDFPFIKVNLRGLTRFTTVKLLWQKSASSEIYSRAFSRDGDSLAQLSMVFAGQKYSGTISSVALLFYDRPAHGFRNNDGEDILITDIELRTLSIWRIIEQILYDWSNPPLWGASAINKVEGVSLPQLLKPNLAVYLVVLTGLAFAMLRRKLHLDPQDPSRRAPVVAVALSLCLCGWIFNESLRWSWRVEQFVDGRARYAGLELAQRVKNNEVRCGMYSDDCASFLYPYF